MTITARSMEQHRKFEGNKFQASKSVFSILYLKYKWHNVCLEKYYNRGPAGLITGCRPSTEAAELMLLIVSNTESHISFGCWSVDCRCQDSSRTSIRCHQVCIHVEGCEESILNFADPRLLLIIGSMSGLDMRKFSGPSEQFWCRRWWVQASDAEIQAFKKKDPFVTPTWPPTPSPNPELCSQPRPLSSSTCIRHLRSGFFSRSPSKKRSRPGDALVFSLHTSPRYEKAWVVLLGWLVGSVQGPDRIFLFAQRQGCLSISPTSGGGLSGLLITMFSPVSLPSLTGCYTGKWESRLGLSSRCSQLVLRYFL